MHLTKQWRYDVDLFALESDFCIICLILIYLILYFIMTINVVLFYASCFFLEYDFVFSFHSVLFRCINIQVCLLLGSAIVHIIIHKCVVRNSFSP